MNKADIQRRTAVTALQIKELIRRLEAVPIYRMPDVPEPPEVKAARRVIKAFDVKKRKSRDAHYARLQARKRALRHAIYFSGDLEKTAKEIDKFAKEVPK